MQLGDPWESGRDWLGAMSAGFSQAPDPTMAYTVEEGPDADGCVQQHQAQVPGCHQVQESSKAHHGLQGHQAMWVVPVVQPADHG